MSHILNRGLSRWSIPITLGVLVLLQACAAEQPGQPVQFVTVEAAAAAVERGVNVVDVRTEREWAEGHLSAARHMPLSTLDHALPGSELGRDAPLLLHCKTGGRASRASRAFVAAGFTDIRVLKPGGYAELAATGLPTDTGRE